MDFIRNKAIMKIFPGTMCYDTDDDKFTPKRACKRGLY